MNYTYRMHDPRLGRFFAVDPLAAKYTSWSPYTFSGNRVIDAVELEGLEPTTPPAYEGQNVTNPKNGNNYSGEGGEWVRNLPQINVSIENKSEVAKSTPSENKSYKNLENVNLSGLNFGKTNINIWHDDIANHPEWQKSRTWVKTFEKGIESYMYTMLSLPLSFGGGLSLNVGRFSFGSFLTYSTLNASSNFVGQLAATKNVSDIDYAGVGISFGTGFIKNPWTGASLNTGLDALVDINGTGNINVFGIIGDKNDFQFGADLFFGGVSNYSSATLGHFNKISSLGITNSSLNTHGIIMGVGSQYLNGEVNKTLK